MAPERSGQGLIPSNIVIKQEVVGPPEQTSLLDDFIGIKIKEELEYKIENEDVSETTIKREEDQDLTSLTWLQNNNLLKSKPLTLADPIKKEPEESPTSDLAEDTGSDSSTHSSRHSPVASVESPLFVTGMEELRSAEKMLSTNGTKYNNNSAATKEKHHYSVPYDPQLHVNSKPPYSFSCLIFMAIEDSHARALPVKEIYSWITDHFPYFIKAPTGWKNSVRHNLSLNKCFKKVDKAPNLGKGSLWIVDPQYRPNLLNALSKAPYHPCASLDRPAKPPILPPPRLTVQQQEFIAMKTQNRLPNPELFPYLSRRLAASEADRINEAEESEEDSLDDVDAATAMLELKHGQGPNGNQDNYKRDLIHQKYLRKRPKLHEDELIPLISTSPSEDHTYSVDQTSTIYKEIQPVSPDEAYDSNDDNSRQYIDEYRTKSRAVDEGDEDSWSSDGAEQRNVASALLHLAGGSRKRGSDAIYTTPTKRAHSQRVKRSHHRPKILQRSPKKQGRGRLGTDDSSNYYNNNNNNNNNNNKNNNNNNNNNNDKSYSGRTGLKPKIEQPCSNTRGSDRIPTCTDVNDVVN